MRHDTVLAHGHIAKSFDYQIIRTTFDSATSRDTIKVTADGAPLFSGSVQQLFGDTHDTLQMTVTNQKQDYLTPLDYVTIFAASAVAMGVPVNRVTPALFYSAKAADAPIALSALTKMKTAVRLLQ